MTSPFATYEEFSNVDGAMYTFANNPTMIGILLAICLAITIYFFYASFNLRQETATGKSSAVLGIVLALITTAGSLMQSQPAKQSPSATHRRSVESVSAKQWQPLALLGMIGAGSGLLRSKKRRSAARMRGVKRR